MTGRAEVCSGRSGGVVLLDGRCFHHSLGPCHEWSCRVVRIYHGGQYVHECLSPDDILLWRDEDLLPVELDLHDFATDGATPVLELLVAPDGLVPSLLEALDLSPILPCE